MTAQASSCYPCRGRSFPRSSSASRRAPDDTHCVYPRISRIPAQLACHAASPIGIEVARKRSICMRITARSVRFHVCGSQFALCPHCILHRNLDGKDLAHLAVQASFPALSTICLNCKGKDPTIHAFYCSIRHVAFNSYRLLLFWFLTCAFLGDSL